MKKTLVNIFKFVLPIVLAGAILWWMYRGIDWAVINDALRDGMDWTWMLLSLPFGISAQVFRALRWKQSLEPLGEKPRHSTCINAIFLSYASSLVLPRIGEFLRCGVLKRYDGISFTQSMGTVVTERCIDIVIILLLSGLTVLVEIPVFARFVRETGLSLDETLGMFTTSGYLVTIACLLLIALTGWYLSRKMDIFNRTKAIVKDLQAGLFSIRYIQQRWLFITYSLGIWVSYFLHFYLTFYCFDYTASLGVEVALVAFVVGTFAVLVPTPNGAGPWHFAVKTVLVLFGVSQTDGAVFVLIVHTIQTALVALLGVWACLSLGTKTPHTLKGENMYKR